MLKNKTVIAAFIAIFTAMGVSTSVEAQILIIDEERIENEASAHKDYNLQTAEIRRQFATLQQFVAQGGIAEQQLAKLEEEKAVIGQENYDQRRQQLGAQYQVAVQQLNQLQMIVDRVRAEASAQIQRARNPILKSILSERGAQVIMYKRLTVENAAGLDITTDFIERLDAALPTVTLANLPTLQPAAQQPAAGEVEGTPIPDGR